MLSKAGFEEIINRITFTLYPTWKLIIRYDGDRPYLQVEDADGICTVTGNPLPWRGRKFWLSPHMCASEVIRTAYKALWTAVEHEFNECFLYRDQPIFDPHRNLELLVEIAKRPDALDVRKAMPEPTQHDVR